MFIFFAVEKQFASELKFWSSNAPRPPATLKWLETYCQNKSVLRISDDDIYTRLPYVLS